MGFFERISRLISSLNKKKPPGPNTVLTKNFKLGEFACNDANKTQVPDEYLFNVKELAEALQVIRDYIDSPLKVFSGYRTPEHNKKIGGVKNSQHMLAKAADLKASGTSTGKLHEVILLLIEEGKIPQGGVGHYPNRFVHYDIRGRRARWTGKGK